MKAHSPSAPGARPRAVCSIFAASFGAFLGLSLLKFGNPPIMEKWVTQPTGFYEFVLGYPWPIHWAYWLLGAVCLLGLATARWKTEAPRWLVLLPALWLLWQWLAGLQTLDVNVTRLTVVHFAACTICFYLGLFCLPQVDQRFFWLLLGGAFLLVLATGFEQHLGGLEETRRYFYLYMYPKLNQFPPEYLKKITSNRIFATLFYPNALAGALLLLMPPLISALLKTRLLTSAARIFTAVVVASSGLVCLYWSGSKGGWLLMLFICLVAWLHLPAKRQLKLAVLLILLLAGTAGFALRYAGFFRKGATSVVARFDYWRAAAQTAASHPLWGTGPGTFAIPYEQIKKPESEMSRLVHNDYLEQASDSGMIGFVLYAALILGGLWMTRPGGAADSLYLGVWLGFLGWSSQSTVEFSLYVPALAWSAFAFLGLMLGARRPCSAPNSVDKPQLATVGSAAR